MYRLDILRHDAGRKQLWQKSFCTNLCSSRSSKQTAASLKKPATSLNRCIIIIIIIIITLILILILKVAFQLMMS